jgi:proteic killer suppression protein
MLDSRRIKSSALRRYAKRGDASRINPKWLEKVRQILGALHAAVSPQDLDMPGFGFHELSTPREGTFAVSVTRNWRITFRWDDAGPFEVDLEDYHGR